MPNARDLTTTALLLACLCLAPACGGGKQSKIAPPSVQQQLRAAQSYLKAGRISDALETVATAIETEPDNPSLYHYRGLIYFRAGRYEEAEVAFRKALEIDTYYTDSHNYLGVVYTEMGRPLDAELEYKVALKDPTYPSPEKVHLNLALLYSDQGREEDALRNFRKSVELNPKYWHGHFELASFLEGQGKLDEAAREYEVARPDYAGSGDFHYRLGLTYFRLGNLVKAEEHLRRVVEFLPGSEMAVNSTELLKTMH